MVLTVHCGLNRHLYNLGNNLAVQEFDIEYTRTYEDEETPIYLLTECPPLIHITAGFFISQSNYLLIMTKIDIKKAI